jgi:hypothetical protein
LPCARRSEYELEPHADLNDRRATKRDEAAQGTDGIQKRTRGDFDLLGFLRCIRTAHAVAIN